MLRPYTSRATRRGDDHVHRALRRGVGSETRRSENLAGHAVRRRVPRRSALAGVSALWVGAGARRTGAKPVPDSVARFDPDLAQPDHAHRLGRPVCLPLPRTHERRARRAGGGTPRREPLGARLRHPSARHAAVSGRHAAGARAVELRHGDGRRRGSDVRRGRVVAGVWLYATATRARDRTGTYGFWSLIAVLVLSYVGSLFSPPPPTRVALAVGGIIFGW